MTPTQQLHLHVVNIYSGRNISGTRVRDRFVSESQGKEFSNGRLLENQVTLSGLSYEKKTKKNEAGWSWTGWTGRARTNKGVNQPFLQSGIGKLLF